MQNKKDNNFNENNTLNLSKKVMVNKSIRIGLVDFLKIFVSINITNVFFGIFKYKKDWRLLSKLHYFMDNLIKRLQLK